MRKTSNIVLLMILVCVTAWSIYTENWYILVTNICVISGVLIEEKVDKMLLQENVNYVLVGKIKKILVPILYAVGAISIIIYGCSKFY